MEEREKKKNIDIELLRLPHYYFRKKNEICHMQILRFVDNIKINIKYLKVIYLNIIP